MISFVNTKIQYIFAASKNKKKMKKMMISLMLMLISMVASLPASATTGKNDLKKMIPESFIVKQTTKFSDGRTLTIYYKKQGMQCEVYSPCNEKDYAMSDASKIKSTNFEVVNKTEGKLCRKAAVGEVLRILKHLVNQYL